MNEQKAVPSREQINAWMADAGWQNSAMRQADLDKVERVVRVAVAAEIEALRKDAEKAHREAREWRENFAALQHALVGETGASGIETAHALRKDKAAAVAAERAWRDAVDEMLTVAHMVASDDPRESINRLISWHVAVALDPAVSSDAAALVAAERERCAKLCEEVALSTTFHRFSRKAARMCAESIRNSSP